MVAIELSCSGTLRNSPFAVTSILSLCSAEKLTDPTAATKQAAIAPPISHRRRAGGGCFTSAGSADEGDGAAVARLIALWIAMARAKAPRWRESSAYHASN